MSTFDDHVVEAALKMKVVVVEAPLMIKVEVVQTTLEAPTLEEMKA